MISKMIPNSVQWRSVELFDDIWDTQYKSIEDNIPQLNENFCDDLKKIENERIQEINERKIALDDLREMRLRMEGKEISKKTLGEAFDDMIAKFEWEAYLSNADV